MRSNGTTARTGACRLGSENGPASRGLSVPAAHILLSPPPLVPSTHPTQVPRASWGGGCDPLGMTPPPRPGVGGPWEGDMDLHPALGSAALTARVPVNAVVRGHPGHLCWECPCTAPGASRRALGPVEAERGCPTVLPFTARRAGAGVMFPRIRRNPFPRSACTPCSRSLNAPPRGSRGEAPTSPGAQTLSPLLR